MVYFSQHHLCGSHSIIMYFAPVWFADCWLWFGWHNHYNKVGEGLCYSREWLEVCKSLLLERTNTQFLFNQHSRLGYVLQELFIQNIDVIFGKSFTGIIFSWSSKWLLRKGHHSINAGLLVHISILENILSNLLVFFRKVPLYTCAPSKDKSVMLKRPIFWSHLCYIVCLRELSQIFNTAWTHTLTTILQLRDSFRGYLGEPAPER